MPLKPQILKNWPPGGWAYFQPETGWNAPTPLAHTFDQQVTNIIKHRLANPRFKLSIDRTGVAAELDAFTCARLGYNPKFVDDPSKKASAHPNPQSPLAKAVELVVGADPSVLLEWLGAGGKPADLPTATKRAAVCVQCDGNVSCNWRDLLTAPVANKIRQYIEAKHHLNLATVHDKDLGVCKYCRCHLPLKVFTPSLHLKNNTSPEDLAVLPPHCWVHEAVK